LEESTLDDQDDVEGDIEADWEEGTVKDDVVEKFESIEIIFSWGDQGLIA
jgi:hypothetical protein